MGVEPGQGAGDYVALVFGIGGIWFFMFVAMLRRRPLIARPEYDPDELAHGHGHGHSGLEGGVSGAHGIH